MDELGNARRTDRTHIPRLVTDGIEQRLVPVEYVRFAAYLDGQLTGGGSTRTAADRRIQHVSLAPSECRMNAAHDGRRVG